MNEFDSGTPFEDFLRSILGEEAAAEAARALQAQGFDPANLPPEFSDPARMRAAMGQFQFLMNTTAGPVNWRMVEDSAKQAAYASQPAQPSTDQLRQLAFSRLKSNATVAIVMSFVWFFTTPVILLLANAVRAQRLCTHAQEIDAPSDVTRKVNIARGIAFGMLLLQVSLIILLIVSENMR